MSSSSSSYDKVARSEASKASPFDQDRAAYRAYNNYFKAAQIRHSLAHWTPETTRADGISYLDLASGRGGDLAKILVRNKAQAVPVTVYAALDVSKESVAEARRRYETMAQNPRTAVLMGDAAAKKPPQVLIDVADVFDTRTTWREHGALATRKYDVVGMQFALHYGCSSAASLGAFLKCVSDVLVDGGYFVGTTVDYRSLRRKVTKQHQQALSSSSSYSSCFTVTLQHPAEDLPKLLIDDGDRDEGVIGIPYRFQLDELVDDIEFSIPWSVLRQEAAKVGLAAIDSQCKNLYDESFRSGYVPDDNVRPNLRESDVELVSFYIGFMFEKKATSAMGEVGKDTNS